MVSTGSGLRSDITSATKLRLVEGVGRPMLPRMPTLLDDFGILTCVVLQHLAPGLNASDPSVA